MPRARVLIAFLILCLSWGSSYLFIRIGLRQLSPLSLVAIRLFIGAIGITLIARIRGTPLRLSRPIAMWLIVIATINTVLPFLLISWGEVNVPSGLASVLNSTVPIFSVLLAAAVLRDEPLTLPKSGGVIIGFAGVVLLLSRDLAHAGIQWSGIVSQGAIVLASICYAVGAVTVRRTVRGTPSLTIAAYSVWIAALQTSILALVFSPPALTSINGLTLVSLLWLGLLGSALAYPLAYFILENWGAARYTLVAYMMPVVGLTLGIMFLHEAVDWRTLAGSAMVILGIVLASLPKRARPQAASSPTTAAVTGTAKSYSADESSVVSSSQTPRRGARAR